MKEKCHFQIINNPLARIFFKRQGTGQSSVDMLIAVLSYHIETTLKINEEFYCVYNAR